METEMKIAVLGTGMVGQTIAVRLSSLGHDVHMGTRDPAETAGRREPGPWGQPSFADWLEAHPEITLESFEAAAHHGEIVLNCTAGGKSLEALRAAGADKLAGKVIVDIANPLDSSRGMPPVLSVSNTDSLGEQIQRAFPAARVVKTLNTMNCNIMVDPSRIPGVHHVFLSGNDAEAKRQVRALLESFGWQHIIDLGDITTARGPEQVLPLWIRLWGVLGNADFNFAVVHG
jgi:predicted dinucleotide-binding enzyme